MLQTIILLAILLILLVLGGWMTFFGQRAFRMCATLFGFVLGVGGMLMAAGQLNLGFGSLVILVGTPLLGLALGLLGAFVPLVAAGLGGLCMGYLYGVGAVFTADALMNGAIAPIIYTSISVALILVTFIICLILHDQAKWLTTAFCGSYMAAYGITLALMWFLAGGFSSTETALNGSFVTKLIALNDMISPKAKMIMLLFALLFGVLGSVIQARMAYRNELDEPLLSALEPESDLLLSEEAFSEQEDARSKKRGLRRKKREEDEDLDVFSFEEEAPAPKKKRRGLRHFEEEDQDDEPIFIESPKKAPVSQVAAVQQVSVPDEDDKDDLDKTQVFKRISVNQANVKQESAVRSKMAQAQSKTSQSPKPLTTPTLRDSASSLSEPKLSKTPSFVPRSQRRK